MFDKDSVWRDQDFYKVIVLPLCLCAILLLLLQFLVFQPMFDNNIKEIKDKTQAELNKLKIMNCKDLGNWLLQDDVFSHDNLIWAQNHYLVGCK